MSLRFKCYFPFLDVEIEAQRRLVTFSGSPRHYLLELGFEFRSGHTKETSIEEKSFVLGFDRGEGSSGFLTNRIVSSCVGLCF